MELRILATAIAIMSVYGLWRSVTLLRLRRRALARMNRDGINGMTRFWTEADVRTFWGYVVAFSVWLLVSAVILIGSFASYGGVNSFEDWLLTHTSAISRYLLLSIIGVTVLIIYNKDRAWKTHMHRSGIKTEEKDGR